MSNSAIYEIRHVASGRAYVGSAVDLEKRWRFHRWQLGRGSHHNVLLQRAWDKHGHDAFVFAVLEFVSDKHSLIEVEQGYLDRGGDSLYNICKKAGSSLGRKFTEESRQKMSLQRMGRRPSPETRAAMSKAGRGKAKSAEHRRKIGEAQKGRVCPEASRAAVSRANKGRVHTDEQRRKNSEAQKARNEKRRGPIRAAIAAKFPDSKPSAQILMREFGMGRSTAQRWLAQWAPAERSRSA